MTQIDLARFRRMCGQFRWLAVFMVVSVGALLIAMHVVAPAVLAMHGRYAGSVSSWAASAIWASPSLFYLYGVWSIGAAMSELARGRLIQPTLALALRRVGLALGFGGILAVFGITNLTRLVDRAQASLAYFDVASMTLGMIGGALYLLGRVIDQAGVVQAELDEII